MNNPNEKENPKEIKVTKDFFLLKSIKSLSLAGIILKSVNFVMIVLAIGFLIVMIAAASGDAGDVSDALAGVSFIFVILMAIIGFGLFIARLVISIIIFNKASSLEDKQEIDSLATANMIINIASFFIGAFIPLIPSIVSLVLEIIMYNKARNRLGSEELSG